MINIHLKQRTRGAAMMLFMMLFMIASIALTYSISRAVYAELVGFRLAYDSKQSFFASDSAVEDMAYRYIVGLTPDSTEVIELGGARATSTSVFNTFTDAFDITAQAVDNGAYRSSALELFIGSGASFNFGVQTGNGGFEFTNGSSVVGNVFSNGYIRKVGGGNATIFGDAISAGPSGLIEDTIVTGSAWAHVIRDAEVGQNAYAYTLDDGEVDGGAEYFQKINGAVVHGSPEIGGVIVGDQDPAEMPISDADIDQIKQDVVDNGTVIASTDPECSGGEYFSEDDLTLGFVKIECDLRIKKKGRGTTLTLTGPIWVEGNIRFEVGPTIEVDPAIGAYTVPIVADNESDRVSSGKIVIENGTQFIGSGSPKSYVLLISQNSDAELGGTTHTAIWLGQQSAGDLLVYAAHGLVNIGNSVSLKEVTGYKLRLNNSAKVIYESGLVNLLFTSGPGGGFTIGSWKEVE